MRIPIALGIVVSLLLGACSNTNYTVAQKSNEYFNTTWYAGKAEVATYTLQQSRYGKKREGKAILIAVTEDFNPKLQVKANGVSGTTISVFKTNFIKRFTTGLYDYSTMTSTFLPVHTDSLQYPIKITASSQDWCGHTWMQVNTHKEDFECTIHSYFEEESYRNFYRDKLFSADQVFAQIKMAPDKLPLGNFKMYLEAIDYRFEHKDYKAIEATGMLKSTSDTTFIYSIKTNDRLLEYTFQKAQPHIIYSWRETMNEGGDNFITEGRLIKTDFLPYWEMNKPEFISERDGYGLTNF